MLASVMGYSVCDTTIVPEEQPRYSLKVYLLCARKVTLKEVPISKDVHFLL
uniref:Uncharacterized protein n=1 Tax=Arundo donax TaxID=35708 RepID=A0A0A9HF52_ARUDO